VGKRKEQIQGTLYLLLHLGLLTILDHTVTFQSPGILLKLFPPPGMPRSLFLV
jgi:hypothetical protein